MADIHLFDGTALAYRSYHAISALSTSSGLPTNAVFGFTKTILGLMRKFAVSHAAAVFDLKTATFRHRMYADYKIHRKPMPDALLVQMPLIQSVAKDLGMAVLQWEGCEADDVIATLACRFEAGGHRVFIVTSDKDALQLLSPAVAVLNPADGQIRDVVWFRARFGLEPASMVDILALSGDASDSVPGVAGIGEKTALKLLSRYPSLQDIYDNLDEISPESLRNRLADGKDSAFLSRNLVTLRKDVPVEQSAEDLALRDINARSIIETFERLEFRHLLADLRKWKPVEMDPCVRADAIALPDGTLLPMADILERPEDFRQVLENASVPKWGTDMKDKIVALAGRGVALRNAAFDVAIARYVSGRTTSGRDMRSEVNEYRRILKEQDQEYLFEEVEMPMVEVLARMELNGIRVDISCLERLRVEICAEISDLERRIYVLAGEVFNINSSQQLARVLFERLGLPPGKKTRTGYSTAAAVLEGLSGRHPLPGVVLQYRDLFKLLTTYCEGLPPYVRPETGRIHPVFNQIATSTGRLSCSNPNLQNLPVRTQRGNRIRRAFRPAEGNIFVSFDYDQIDLRILAHCSGDENLMRAFLEGKDVHQETADVLFGSPSLFSGPVAAQEGDLRRIAKTINFGIIYGMSPYGLSEELGIPVEDAARFIEDYFRKFPGVRRYMDKTESSAREKGFVTTILGRRRYVPELQAADRNQREFGRRAAVNMPIQGSAADLVKLAMVRIHREFLRNRWKSMLVLQIHDELLFDAAPAEVPEIVAGVRHIMESAFSLKVPLRVQVKTGPNYLDLTDTMA